MRCSDGNYYVVKFQNNPQHRRVLANEVLATGLAALMGLPTAAVAIIEVDSELIRLTPDLHIELPWSRWSGTWKLMPCQPGLQFGSRYIGDPRQITLVDFLSDRQVLNLSNLDDFVGILVFDLWTCNTDPRQVLFDRQEIGTSHKAWMIDQGFCFNSGEWNFPDKPRRNLFERKIVYQQVRGIETFEPWLDALESGMDAHVLFDIAKTIPPEWYEFNFESLHQLLEQLDSRRGRVRELLWSARSSTPLFFPSWLDGLNRLSDPLAKSDESRTLGCTRYRT
jgi:hypothetical protein